MYNELMDAIKNDSLMDYFSSNGYKYNKDDLIILLVQLAYHVKLSKYDKMELMEELTERLSNEE